MMVGMHVMTEDRLERLQEYIHDYEVACKVCLIEFISKLAFFTSEPVQELSKLLKKNFNFPKQHAAAHLIDDIVGVGVTANSTTRTGEGMHQEIRQAHAKTNGKDAETQVLRPC
jgi:hypothetical protein